MMDLKAASQPTKLPSNLPTFFFFAYEYLNLTRARYGIEDKIEVHVTFMIATRFAWLYNFNCLCRRQIPEFFFFFSIVTEAL